MMEMLRKNRVSTDAQRKDYNSKYVGSDLGLATAWF
jgi:hypothetical protein